MPKLLYKFNINDLKLKIMAWICRFHRWSSGGSHRDRVNARRVNSQRKIQNNSAKLYKDHVLAKRCSQNLATPGFNVNMTYYSINNWRCNDVMGKWVKLYLRCPPYSLISSSYVPNFKLYFALRHDKHECVLMKCSGGIFSHCILH